MRLRAFFAFAACLISAATTSAAPVAMTVDPTGLITLKLDGRTVADGRWALRADSYVPVPGPSPIQPGPIVTTTATQDRPGHATVHEVHAAVRADYDLDLAGEDLRISAHVVNTDAAHAQKALAFAGLTFRFARAPDATMGAWHYSYLNSEGLMLLHPSVRSPLGVWWAGDDRFAFAAHSESEFDRSDLVVAEWSNHENTVSPDCAPAFYTDRPLPPGAAVDVSIAFRITADRSLPHLLGAYKQLYDRRFPLPLYTPDPRPLGMFAFADQQHVTRSNPYGYHADHYRFDTARGTAAYLREFVPPLLRGRFMGTIFWSPGGYDPPMYPPDFDVLPPSVQANIPTLVKGFHDAGLRIGLGARPGDGVSRPPHANPIVYRLSADDPAQMKAMLDRFRHAMAMGFDMFYLDSIGGFGINDVRILRQIRDAVGPDVLLYSENCTDLSLAYADHFCEWEPTGNLLWTGDRVYAALRLLRPRATWLCVSRTRDVIPAEFGKLGLVPLVPDQSLLRVPAAREP